MFYCKFTVKRHRRLCGQQIDQFGYAKLVNFFEVNQHAEFSLTAEMDEDVSVEMQALREVALLLTGRKAEVYEAMIQRAASGQERLQFSDIAKKYGVTPKQITKDQERIMQMVRRRVEELKKEMQD